jgi:hypothetical protein
MREDPSQLPDAVSSAPHHWVAYVTATEADADILVERGRLPAGTSIFTPPWPADRQSPREPVEISFVVVGGHIPDAVEEAERMYAAARASAGLPEHSPQSIAVTPTSLPWADPRHFELLFSARQMLSAGQYEFAIIAAQSAIEVYIEGALTRLLTLYGELGAAVSKTLSRYALRDRQSCAVFEALTGWSAARNDLPAYHEHVHRRNGVIHRGDTATADEAGASVDTVSDMFGFVGRAWLDGIARANARA